MKVKEESEKVVLKLNIQKTKIMASGPITSWQIGGETVEIVTDFIFLGLKITADHQPRLDAWDKCSGLVHWEDPEGLGGEGGGRGDRDGEYM